MPGLNFDITANNSNFLRRLNEVRQGMDSVTSALESKGASIEQIFGGMTDSATHASAVLQELGKSFDVSTAGAQVRSLTQAINDMEHTVSQKMQKLEELKDSAAAALDAGDTAGLQAINSQIASMGQEIKQVTGDIEEYRNALSTVENMAGFEQSQSITSTPKLYSNIKDYNKASELSSEVNSLNDQIANFSGSDEELEELKQKLEETQSTLTSMQEAAAEAASSLGANLGTRASQASTAFYELTNAITEQESTISELQSEVEGAASAIEELKAAQEGGVDNNAELEIAQQNYEILTARLANAKDELLNLQAAQIDASSQWESVSREVDIHNSKMVSLLGGYDKYQELIGQLPGPIQGVIGSINGMTGAAKAFIATPLGAILAAIALALQAVYTWFNSSVEGQMAFAEASGYVTGILDQLKELIITAGKKIYEFGKQVVQAFENPKEAIHSLWEAIKTNLVNRAKGIANVFVNLANVIDSAFHFDWQGVKDDYKNLGNSVIQTLTGIENATDKVAESLNDMHNAAKEKATISKEEKELDIAVHEWAKRKAELDKEKAEAQAKMYNTSLSATDRAKALQDYKRVLDEQYAKEEEFADKRIELQERTMALTSNTIEDENTLRDLQAARTQLDARKAMELASLQRRANSIERAGNNSGRVTQKQIEAQEKLNQILLDIEDNNIKERISIMEDGVEKQLKVIDYEYSKREEEIKKRQQQLVEINKAAGVGVGNDGLTDMQRSSLDEMTRLNIENRTKQLYAVQKAEVQAMRDYLSEYGTFQEKKLAIAQEYAEKIAKASNEWERKSLEKERDTKISSLETDAINQKIDWAQVFSGFGGMFTEMMQATLDDINLYIASDKFKSLEASDKKAIIEGRDNLAANIPDNTKATLNFGRLAREVQNYQNSLIALNVAQEQHTLDVEALSKATEEYDKALRNGTKEEQEAAKAALDIAQTQALASAETVKSAQASAEGAAHIANKTATDINKTMSAVNEGLQKLSSGSLKGAYDGIIQMGDKLGGVMGKVADSLRSVPIVGWVLSILDILQDGLSNLVGGLLDGIFNAVGGIISDVLSGDLFVTIINSVKNGIGKILNGITFGGFDALQSAITGSNAKEVAETTERLTKRNELLTAAIDSLKSEMEKARGLQSVYNANEAREKQAEYIQNTAEILAAQMGYHAAHHSNEYYIDKAMSAEDWAEIGHILNRNITSAAELWQLSPEDLRKLQQSPHIWDIIANSGEYDKSEYLDNYLALADSVDEITQALNETLTQISFDSMYDSFISSLMDMDKSAADFADDVSKYFMQAMLSNKIGELYSERLEEWYNDFAEKMKDDGTLSSEEIAALQADYNKIVSEAIADRDAIAAATGYDKSSYSQEASRGNWQSMSEDTGQELNGRFTAVQIAAESVSANMIATLQALDNLSLASSLSSSYLESILTQNVIANSHLESIAISSASLAAIRSELKKMNDKLTNI